MKALDIMSTPVLTVGADTPVRQLAQLLASRGISAVPVVKDERLIGIVSEADLLYRHEIGTDCAFREDPWWLQLFRASNATDAYVRTHAVRVADIMTRDVVAVAPGTELAEVAALLEKHDVKRVPVVEDGRVVGIVSRSDLVKALAAAAPDPRAAAPLSDAAIKERLMSELERQPWWHGNFASVEIADGVVTYRGMIEFDGEDDAARVAAEAIPGVRRVVDQRFLLRDAPYYV